MEKFRNQNLVNISNLIVFTRTLFIPLFLFFLSTNQSRATLLTLTLFYLADAVDGYLARKLNMETKLGAYLDAAVDMTFIYSSYFVFYLLDKLPIAIFLLLLVPRTASGIIYLIRGNRFRPSWLRKAGAMLMFLLIPSIILEYHDEFLAYLTLIINFAVVIIDHALLHFLNKDSDYFLNRLNFRKLGKNLGI